MHRILKNNGILLGVVALILVFVSYGTVKPGTANELKPDPRAVFPVETLVANTSSGTFTFTIELADDPAERERGLMFREEMLPTHGMLFDFKRVEPVFMWMKNTPLALDLVFIKPDGTVARIEHNTTPQSLRVIGSSEPVSHVLELNAGMSKLIGLKRGDKLTHTSFEKP